MTNKVPQAPELSVSPDALASAERDIDALAHSLAEHLPPAIEAAEAAQHREEAQALGADVIDAYKARFAKEHRVRRTLGRVGVSIYRAVTSVGDDLGFTEVDKAAYARDEHTRSRK